MSATFTSQTLAVPLRPLAETAALFRQECFALDHLVEELYRDVEQLRDELVRKSDEIDDGRKKLAERGRQLAEQRKESGRLVHLLEQQETRLSEALTEIKTLREQTGRQSDEARDRDAARQAFLEQNVRSTESERDQLRHELHVLQATAAANGGTATSADTLSPLMSELGDMRRQLSETQSQLDDARRQLSNAIQQSTAAIEQSAAALQARSVEAAPQAPDLMPTLLAELAEMRRQLEATQQDLTQTRSQLGEAHTQLAAGIDRAAAASAARDAEAAVRDNDAPSDPRVFELLESLERQVAQVSVRSEGESTPDAATQERLAAADRERIELEAELELVRTRATELQEVVTQQRRELVEQRSDITTELRLLRELVEQHKHIREDEPVEDEPALVGAASRNSDSLAPAPIPSSAPSWLNLPACKKTLLKGAKKK